MEVRVARLLDAIFARTCVLDTSQLTRRRVGRKTWTWAGPAASAPHAPKRDLTACKSAGGRGDREGGRRGPYRGVVSPRPRKKRLDRFPGEFTKVKWIAGRDETKGRGSIRTVKRSFRGGHGANLGGVWPGRPRACHVAMDGFQVEDGSHNVGYGMKPWTGHVDATCQPCIDGCAMVTTRRPPDGAGVEAESVDPRVE